jgi:electron transfer flavoprotein beta subunit
MMPSITIVSAAISTATSRAPAGRASDRREAAIMHIIVPLKQVFDPNTPIVQLRIGADGRSLELPSGMSPVMNGYDANAVEAALALKEKHGGSVTALGVGDETAKNALRRAIGMGADRAVHITGPVGLGCDSAQVAALLSAAIRKLPPAELILCGRQASDTDSGQVPLLLAAALCFAAVVPVKAIAPEGDGFIVERIGDGITQRLRVPAPALLGVSNEINKPRVASLKGVMLAKKAEIPTWSAEDLGMADAQPAMILRRVSIPAVPDTRAEVIVGASGPAVGAALADRLRQEGMI